VRTTVSSESRPDASKINTNREYHFIKNLLSDIYYKHTTSLCKVTIGRVLKMIRRSSTQQSVVCVEGTSPIQVLFMEYVGEDGVRDTVYQCTHY